MFGQVLDKLDSWLGRSFLLARYFPWLLFATANLLLAAVEFSGVSALLASEYSKVASSDKVIDLVLALGAVAVVAYTLSPVILPVTKLLEGQHLPQWIAEPLLLRRAREVRVLAERHHQLFRDRTGLDKTQSIMNRLIAVRAAGKEHHTVTDPASIDRAENEVANLRSRRPLNRSITATELALAVEAVATALQRNCADPVWLKAPVAEPVKADAARLDRSHTELISDIVPYAIDIAQKRERHALDRHESLFAEAELAPTRLGNDVAALRSYCDTRYGFEFDFFWPRLQLVMKDDKLATKLSNAKIQVEFSILSLFLSCFFVATWFIVLAGWGHSLASLLVLAAFGPPVIFMWLWLVHESYSTYAELVRGAIDVSRFDLLQALRRPLPSDTDEEIAVWDQAARLLVLNKHEVKVTLKHQAS